MSNRPNIEEILQSAVGIQPAHPKPFFTGRVLDRIRLEVSERATYMTPRFRLAVLAVSLIVALNILLYVFQPKPESNQVITEWKNTTPEWVIDYTENPGSSLWQVPNK